MSSERIAVRYANALLRYANEKGIAEELYANTDILVELFNNGDSIKEFLVTPASPIPQKVEMIQKVLNGRVHSVLIDFLTILVKNHRASKAYNALLLFRHLYRSNNNILELRIETAHELEKEEIENISQFVKKTYQKELEVSVAVKPELIGGVLIIVGDRIMDLSVVGQLKSIRKSLGVN